jgi:hypothetical protein
MPRVSTSPQAVTLASLLALAAGTHGRAEEPVGKVPGLRVVWSQKVWDAAPHNAFTDLAWWRGRFYCSFREGAAHGSYDGAARVLVSDDGRAWEPLVRFADEGLDLRDPKLCVLPDGRLLLGVGVRKRVGDDPDRWDTASRVYLSADGTKWDGPHAVGDPNVWMWRYVTSGSHVYSIGYAKPGSKKGGGETFLRLYRSEDGVRWEAVGQTEAGGGYVNEAAFVFEPGGRCVVLLRREGGDGRLGLADAPYTKWTWTDLKARFNGPALLRLPDGHLLAGGRSKALGSGAAQTVLGWLSTDPPALNPALVLPSRHETGYPGLVQHDGRIWASYYSSQSGKGAIYIAELELITPAR